MNASNNTPSLASDDRKAALALLIGTLGDLVTMAIHPHGTIAPDQLERMALTSEIAHSLAMVSFLLLFTGVLGLTRRLASYENPESPDRLSLAALVTFAFASTALLIATAVSGFIGPEVMRHMVRDLPANLPEWNRILTADFQFNQAFAQIYSVAASLSIALWSIASLRNGGLSRFTTLYGCILPPILVILIAVGHLRLDVHGMAAVVIVHTIWFLAAAAELRQPQLKLS